MLSVVSPACLLLLALVVSGAAARGQESKSGAEDEEMSVRRKGRVRAPELEGHRGWLNTEKPLSLAALRGKVVLLDFWTYGCINCMHVIPDLQRLEEKYARELVVIGVHSAKFENEKETENIRRVILRYGIEHPVVNDADFRIWNEYAVSAWPTQVLIDPAGYVVGQARGEGNYEVIDRAIGELVADFRQRGALNEEPLKLVLERAKVGDLPLAFPGKLVADEKGGRLFIADSNHNRVVVTTLDGTLVDTVGTGERGSADGPFDRATFYRPQGLALDGDALYVADTANHLVRRVDLKTRAVTTVAGTGRQTREYPPRGGPALTTALSSPWDLLPAPGGALYVAMAGPHQIWKLDLKRGELSVFAGSAREARLDGPRTQAAFAQPSGLATDGSTLYVADSESNIIRAIDLADEAPPRDAATNSPAASSTSTPTSSPSAALSSTAATVEGEVRTLAGGDLFEFGDKDGRGDDVRLQHPLGVLYHEGRVFIADTYNHKIKTLDPKTRAVRTFLGTGRPGQTDGPSPAFYEPGGLAHARGKLYVADTNNHAVRVVDLKTRSVTTLRLGGLRPPERAAAPETNDDGDAAATGEKETALAPQRLNASGDAALVVDVKLPAGHHLNPNAPHRYRITAGGGDGGEARLALADTTAGAASPTPPTQPTQTVSKTSKDLQLPLRVPLRAVAPGAASLRVRLTLYYCREDDTGVCRIKTLAWRVPVEVTADGAAPREVRVQGKVE